MSLPDWLNKEAWEGYVEMRKKIRCPLTERAVRITLNKLEAMKEQGYDPNLSLDESTQRGWRGVFPQGEPKRTDRGSGMRAIYSADDLEYFRKHCPDHPALGRAN